MANASALEALADPTRRRLFERLRAGPCSVTELAGTVPLTQPAVSQHLRVLRDARLVSVRKQGQHRIYSVNLEGLAELLEDPRYDSNEKRLARRAELNARVESRLAAAPGEVWIERLKRCSGCVNGRKQPQIASEPTANAHTDGVVRMPSPSFGNSYFHDALPSTTKMLPKSQMSHDT